MRKFLYAEDSLSFLPPNSIVETYLCDELPPLELCPSAYALIFKNDEFLMTDLREGERPKRQLDVPGGHVDEGETPDQSIVREVFEETGVHVRFPKLVAYKEITITTPRPDGWRYPYPTGYMLFYVCEIAEETFFEGNADTHGRVWVPLSEYKKSQWCIENKILLDEAFHKLK